MQTAMSWRDPMNMALPPPLATYLNAEATTDTETLASCFAADAVVHDEGHVIEGLEAIKAWKKSSQAKYQYRVQPLDMSQDRGAVKVRVRLTGNFPGSPVVLTYTFVLAGDKITSLAIH